MYSTKSNVPDRMRIFWIFCLLCWPGLLVAQSTEGMGQSKEQMAQSTEQKVRSFLLAEMKARRIPGLQAAVIRHGHIILQVSMGLANAEDLTPVSDRTVFPVRSVKIGRASCRERV